jgi:pyruvate dehydrogenase (quinone)
MTTGDFIIERLTRWGVTRIYGYPGDGINGLVGAIERTRGKIAFVQARHEEMAAFMACAHAKYTGEVGVCLATSGPGAIHLLNGLYDAQMDHAPVVALVGQASTEVLGGSYQQEVDLPALFKDVAHEFCQTIVNPAAARHVIDRAFRTSRALRCVTAVIVPKDIPEMDAVEPAPAHDTVHSGAGFVAPRVVPQRSEIEAAAAVLNAGSKVAILVGAGAKNACDEVLAVADVLGAGVAKALLGKAVLPDDVSYVTGTIGLLGTGPSAELMQGCDTLLMIGSTFPYAEYLPKEGQARGVQIDIDPRNLSLRYPMEVNLTGDAAETLRALLPLLERKEDRAWQQRLEAHKTRWLQVEHTRAQMPAHPLNPQRVFAELSPLLPDNAVLASDAGTNTNWTARYLQMRRGMKYALSGSLATMGPAVPYAIAAKFAYPDRVAFAITGDGAMQMNGNAELITIARYWREWSEPRLVVLVLNNRDLNQVTWEMRTENGDARFADSQSLPDFPYAAYAESVGLRGIRVDDPDGVAGAWREALACDRPVVLEAVTDPNVPTLPPHISFEQSKNFASAILQDVREEAPAAVGAAQQLLANLRPPAK